MCGIAGFSGPPEGRLLHGMCDRITHRGPDESGYHEGRRMQLGMRRLSIVDLAGGRQPIVNEDGSILTVFNGELYNHLELRRELQEKGHVFRTRNSDTEIIVHAYEEWGTEWAEKVNGMFGLAIWDRREGQLLLYRDRMGKKPLYYALQGKTIVFGSEIKSLLLHPRVSRDPDPAGLASYFALKNTSAPNTAYAAVKQLLPGDMLLWKDGEARTTRWWKPSFSPIADITEEEAVREIRRLLESAVHLRMQCDVPFGAYLSGGVDSSTVASLMSRFHSHPVQTFCLGYEDDVQGQFKGKAQDIHHAREMARRIGSDHHELIINAQTFAESMPDVMAAFDEPFSGTISTFFLSTLIRQHVKVAISGDGADETFASYLTHRLSFPMEHLLRFEREGKGEYDLLSDEDLALLRPFDTPEQFAFLRRIASPVMSEWRDSLSVFTTAERAQLFMSGFFGSGLPPVNPYRAFDAGGTAQDTLNRTLEVEQAELLPNQILPFVDRLSMAHSVEVRCPFLDHRLVEFVDSLPGEFKIRDGVNKYILKKAVEGIIPPEVINRPKEGFVQPIYSWMHGALRPWTVDLLEALPGEVINLRYVEPIKRAFLNGDTAVNAKIWNLACFSLWWSQAQA
ncbi:MAG: asparagine synthase (glutamine-hydrolyzing) [Pseudodesulfovibrio sp.]|uniref:asparagine synthase (glutamine-hydrolyzing) n=1 Tax=Pseudodesulfovibrio sp. TaxID=2035812 RepID=UPI003D09DE63